MVIAKRSMVIAKRSMVIAKRSMVIVRRSMVIARRSMVIAGCELGVVRWFGFVFLGHTVILQGDERPSRADGDIRLFSHETS